SDLHYQDPDFLDDKIVSARVLQQPNCLEAVISKKGNKIIVSTEREFLVEVIGETKICVAVHPGECPCDDEDDDEDDWTEELTDSELAEEINPDFLVENENE